MQPTITKAEMRAELSILTGSYLAKGGKITRKISREMARKRKAQGLATPEEYEANARAQFAADDKAYYDMADRKEFTPVLDADGTAQIGSRQRRVIRPIY